MLDFFFIKMYFYQVNHSKTTDNSIGSMKVASLWFGGRQAMGYGGGTKMLLLFLASRSVEMGRA